MLQMKLAYQNYRVSIKGNKEIIINTINNYFNLNEALHVSELPTVIFHSLECWYIFRVD